MQMVALGVPFWLAGGFATPEKFSAARAAGAYGIQVGTDFAFCDESVSDGPPPDDLTERFERACVTAAEYGVHLVDWIACDDQLFRSSRLALYPGREWWSIP